MTDPLDRLLRPPAIEPLAAPAGHFEEITRQARTRRRNRIAASAGLLTVVVVASAIAGGALFGQPEARRTPATPSSPSPAASPSTMTPSANPVPAVLPGTGPVPAHFKPWSVSYVSTSMGFLLGDAPCSQAPCTSLAVTGDSGRTWRGLPAPRASLPKNRFDTSPAGTDVRDVRFANPRDGWVFGGALYATHDGGRHWRRIALRTAAGSVAVQELSTDGKTSYAVVASCAGDPCQQYRLYEAAVGSDAWHPVAGALGSTASTFIGSLALSGHSGIVLADGRPWLRAGQRWQPVGPPSCRVPGTATSATVSASDARMFVLCGEGAAGSWYLSPWVSDDNGGTWRTVADGSARVPTGEITVAAATKNVLLVSAATPDRGGALLRSSDGGRTFADARMPAQANGWWYVGARSATSLVALPATPDGAVWTSRDGGRTWQRYRFR